MESLPAATPVQKIKDSFNNALDEFLNDYLSVNPK